MNDREQKRLRLGQAADILGVSPDTLRRWISAGRLAAERTSGGQRTVLRAEVARLLAARRRSRQDRPIVARSARNRFAGVVTRIERDRIVGLVEVQAGPHRLVSLMTAEAVEELGLRVGSEAICVVKATHVVVEVPEKGTTRSGRAARPRPEPAGEEPPARARRRPRTEG